MIPKGAKKVFEGTVFSIYRWKQKMFDSTFAIFERAKILDGSSIIATVGNKIIMIKQKQPGTPWYYSLPGGYLDHHKEDPKIAALRELKEETGYQPNSIKLWKNFPLGGRIESNHYLFIARDCRKVAKQSLDGGEKIKVELKTFEQFLNMVDKPDFHNRDIIIEVLKARLSARARASFKKVIFG